MAIINQNAVAVNVSANLAKRDCVVVGSMKLGISSVSPWRLPSPSMPETTDTTGFTASYRGKPGRFGRLASASLLGCAGRTTTAPFGLAEGASRTPRTAIRPSLQLQGQLHQEMQQGSIAVCDNGN